MLYRFLSPLLILLISQTASADLNAVLEATCRVQTATSMGTGVVYKDLDGFLFIFTAGHVAVDKDEAHKTCTVEFFGTGHSSGKLSAEIVWTSHTKNTYNDLCIIKIDKKTFGKYPVPPAMKLEDVEVEDKQVIVSCGCPEGVWPCLWRGHVVSHTWYSCNFQPFPAGGRSGSPIFDEKGEKLLGIIIWNNKSLDQGTAISTRQIYNLTKWPRHRTEAPAL